MTRCSRTTALLLGGLLWLLAGVGQAGEVSLAVAANFRQVAGEIAARFTAASGHRVKISAASTGTLYAQIAHGAPYDLFLAADRARPLRAVAEGLAVAGSAFTYARGRLALWSPVAGRFRDGAAWLCSGGPARLAIANPATAPYGVAARELLQGLGCWRGLQGHLVRGASIAQAFQFAATENADAGLVAWSQVRAWRGAPGSLWLVPEARHAPIRQTAVLLQRGRGNPAARALLEFLRGPAARALIRRHGYEVE